MHSAAYLEKLAGAVLTFRPLLLKHLKNPDEAADMMQEAFVEIASTVQVPDTLRGYVHGVIHFKIIRQIRARQMWRRRDSADMPAALRKCRAPHVDPLQERMDADKQRLLRRAMLTLRPREREVMERALAGQDAEQIRAMMGLSETQFRVIRSRRKLRLTHYIAVDATRPYRL